MSYPFINRERELLTLIEHVKIGSKVVVYGLRGVGKTRLVKEVIKAVEDMGYKALYIDCMRVISPRDLLMNVIDTLNFIVHDPEAALEYFFKAAIEKGIKLIVFDEFTSLLNGFGSFSPFRGRGGAKAVVRYLRHLIENYPGSIIALDTSMKALFELVLEYSSPLMRCFNVVIELHPLDFSSACTLLREAMKHYGKSIDDEVAFRVIELIGGNPFYIDVIARSLPSNCTVSEAIKLIEAELKDGILNMLFTGLLDKLSPSEKEVLTAVANGCDRYSSLSRKLYGINIAGALESLVQRGYLRKIVKGRKDVHYTFTDRAFKLWLQLTGHPMYTLISFKRMLAASIGFESYIRELLRAITKPITLKDETGKTLTLHPFKDVRRITIIRTEIDVVASTDKETIVCECYLGEKAPMKKLHQLIKHMKKLSEIGENVTAGILFSYFGFKENVIKKAKKLANIYLLEQKQIAKIAKETGLPAF